MTTLGEEFFRSGRHEDRREEQQERTQIEKLAEGIVELLKPQLSHILHIQEKIMASQSTGLQNLQAFRDQFRAFVQQITSDIGNLTTAVNAAIAALSSSEDPAVQAAVNDLQTAMASLTGEDSALQGLTAALTAAEAPPPAQNQAAPAGGETKAGG